MTADPFDALAAGYDDAFTAGVLGTRMRAAVRRRLDACFTGGQHLVELGCGTGEDAVYLAGRGLEVTAIDRSAAMVDAAREKVARAGLADRVHLRHQSIEAWTADPGGPFDGALSNFGVLNCVDDLAPVARALAASVRSGGRAVLVVMGPLVPWEWLWFLARGRPRDAFRRRRRGGVAWRGQQVRYPSPRTVRRTFRPAFRARRTSAVGALLPPTYAESWAARHPRLIDGLDRWERRVECQLAWLADHYVLELERR
ncbi:MAG TPA: class I SAM-dependent methyltransferase [Thermoanaerobaculia bacterium]|jgi:SAM-dependent methyltransferase